mmetsp:Transcript_142/g.200  ORF Transcript_142/g.200 Transcript_142/m.200 type:complete len:458 (+) Transcript_142:162-1535(+)
MVHSKVPMSRHNGYENHRRHTIQTHVYRSWTCTWTFLTVISLLFSSSPPVSTILNNGDNHNDHDRVRSGLLGIRLSGIGYAHAVVTTATNRTKPSNENNSKEEEDGELYPTAMSSSNVSAPTSTSSPPVFLRLFYVRNNNKSENRRTSTTTTTTTTPTTNSTPNLSQILAKAGKRGLGGGISGAIAGVIQVLSLMWLRTVVNYQCRYGTPFRIAFATLYNQGGIARFYKGLLFALIQAPLARFASTAANDSVEALLMGWKRTRGWGLGPRTLVASILVGTWRIFLMPIDTCKTVLQVDNAEGFRNLIRKVRAGKITVLYQGAMANAVSAIASHYPWFYTYNFLSANRFIQNFFRSTLLRNASIGFASSVVSDTLTNCIRVVKTTKQSVASKHAVSYGEVVAMVVAADGWKGLFGRGLTTRILANALQSVMFTIIWRGLAERWNHENLEDSNEEHMQD